MKLWHIVSGLKLVALINGSSVGNLGGTVLQKLQDKNTIQNCNVFNIKQWGKDGDEGEADYDARIKALNINLRQSMGGEQECRCGLSYT